MTDEEAIAAARFHWLCNSKYGARPRQVFLHLDPLTDRWWVHEDYVCAKFFRTEAEAARAYLNYALKGELP